MTDKKIVDIGSGKKPCQFCGKTPACPDWTCERIHAVTMCEDGSWTVDFTPMIEVHIHSADFPPDGDEAA